MNPTMKKPDRLQDIITFDTLHNQIDLIYKRINEDYYWEDGAYVKDWVKEDLTRLVELSWLWWQEFERGKPKKRENIK